MTIPFPISDEPAGPTATLSAEAFEALLAEAQPRLRGYVASLMGGWADVDDLVQETNLVLVRKQTTFVPGTNFISWAFRVAYFKATTWRRDRMREGRVVLSETTFQEMAAHAEERFEGRGELADTLADCLKGLSPEEADLVQAKYVERQSLVDVAANMGCSAQILHKRISRIRLVLRTCIHQKLRALGGNRTDFP